MHTGMRTMAALMASITLVTTALFAHALTTAAEQPSPTVARIASR
ncbi:MAG TPA: hypothetical protein VM049_13405 [Gaiellaceae bacterium]|nr:hypothetical protein [Gaiellaceae bacterium]